MIVYGQNGEALRPSQGYPVRLLLPGWEGNACVKRQRRIEISDVPFMTVSNGLFKCVPARRQIGRRLRRTGTTGQQS